MMASTVAAETLGAFVGDPSLVEGVLLEFSSDMACGNRRWEIK